MRMGIGLGVGINRSNYAQGIFNAYSARVVADGGVVESGTCVDAVSSLLQSASLLLIPSGYKGGKLYAEIPTNGNGDLTWTRGSDAFRTNASGVLQRVPWNLLSWSEDFTNAYWTKLFATITANTTTAPNGTLTADTLNVTATAFSGFFASLSGSTTNYNVSIYAKKNTKNWLYFVDTQGTSARAWFDLNNGVLGTVASGYTATITNVGDGWYLCTLSNNNAQSLSYYQLGLSDANNSNTPTSSGSAFIWGAQLVQGTTAQTYLPTTDRLNFPRLSYMYGSCPSALLEPQRTNLVLNSQNLSAVTWTTNGNTVTANYATSPDGTQNATRIIPTTANQFHINFASFTVTAATSISVFVKADGYNFFQIYGGNSTGGPLRYSVVVNLSNGTIDTIDTITSSQVSIIAMNNGWYRITISNFTTYTSGSSFVGLASIPSSGLSRNANFDITYSGNGTSGALVYGVQVEQGAYPTTYIPTTSATATRVADSFSRNNIYTNGLISASGGTWFVEFRNNVPYLGDAAGDNIILGVSTLVSDNCIRFNSPFSSSSRIAIAKRIGGVTTVLYTTTTNTCKIAIKWDGSILDIFENGVKVVSGSSFTEKNMEFLSNGSNAAPKFIQQMALFPTPLTDAQCQTLTT